MEVLLSLWHPPFWFLLLIHCLRIKLEKCEFLKTETGYLGFHIGDGCSKPQDQKMKPLMDFDLTDSMSKAEGVQKIRQFIGSCNLYRRHL